MIVNSYQHRKFLLDIIFDVRNPTFDVKVRTDKVALFNALMLPQCYLYLQDDSVKYNETFPFRLHLVVLAPHALYWWLGTEVDVVWRFTPHTNVCQLLKDRHNLVRLHEGECIQLQPQRTE